MPGISELSQAGRIAPLAASKAEDLPFVIVESAPGVTGDEQDLFVFANTLRDKGRKEAEISRAIELRRSLYECYRTGMGKTALESELKSAAGERWFRQGGFPEPPLSAPPAELKLRLHRFRLDVEDVWSKVQVPVLAVWGAHDRLVPAQKSKDIIDAILRRSVHSDFHLQIFPAGKHRLSCTLGASDPWSQLRVIPKWPMILCDWVKQHVRDNE